MSDMRQTFRRVWVVPQVVIQLYLSTTLILLFFGPWPWPLNEPTKLLWYLIAGQLAVLAGYLLAWKKVADLNVEPLALRKNLYWSVIFVKYSAWITCLLLFPTFLSRTGQMFPDIMSGIANPGMVYNENQLRLERGNVFVIVEYVRMFLSPALIGIVPMGLVVWSELSTFYKVLTTVSIVAHLAVYLATGTNKGMADFVVTTPFLLLLGARIGTFRIRISRHALALAICLAFLAFLHFFSRGQEQREGGVGQNAVVRGVGSEIIQADPNHPLSTMLGYQGRIAFESLSRYMCQGYFALSYGFNNPAANTYGFGNSLFLARNMNVVLNTTRFTDLSGPGLLETYTGWGMLTSWHSIYLWFASDVGFVGALLVVGVFSYIAGLSWGSALRTGSHWAIIMFYLMLICLFYIPANNQVFQSGETFFCFFLVLFLWTLQVVSRRRGAKASQLKSSRRSGPPRCSVPSL